MKKKEFVLALAMILHFGVLSGANLPKLNSLTLDQQRQLLSLLGSDCVVSQGSSALGVLELGTRLDPVLWEAYIQGPPSEFLLLKRGQLFKDYKELQRTIASQGAVFCDQALLEKLRSVTEEQYIEQGMKKVTLSYRSAALVNLGFVALPSSVPRLRKIAVDPKNYFKGSAQNALRILADAKRLR